ncbi:MAG: hypothetical protein FJ090_14135 [Deltaproteobacteria bacterium]|nr:hypothetical protein [Deltaproteobacteria bacterium]
MLLSIALLACSPETALTPFDPGSGPDELEELPSDSAEDPSPYIIDDSASAETPALTAAEVGTAIEAAIDVVRALSPHDIADAYESVWDLRDDGTCPYYYPEYVELYNQYIWYDSCTAASGASFDGYAYYSAYHDYVGSYYTYDRYFSLYGSPVNMTMPNGEMLTGSGTAYMYDIDYWAYSFRAANATIQGTWRWDGATFADSWLGDGVSIDLSVSGTQYYAGATYTSINGSLAEINDQISAVNFDSVYLMNSLTGTNCADEPGGTIRIRDAEGNWYEATFNGPAYSGAPSFPAYCDGCADVWWRGENIGEACPDTSGLVNWESNPWN